MGEAAVVGRPERPTIVSVSGLWKRYRKQVAVTGVDLSIRQQEIYGLIGPDGAGKSSLLKAIAGVLSFDEGTVQVFGTGLTSERAAERIKSRVGFLPQGLGQSLYPDLSVDENITFFADLRLVPKVVLEERKQRLLTLTRLDRFRDRSMRHLSGGMKQKLGLVCTLIHEPDLIILDEPTTGVDPVSRRDFWAILSELVERKGLSVLVSTAYMDEAARFHRLSLMYQGRVLASGTPDEIRQRVPGTLVTVRTEDQVGALSRIRRRFQQVDRLGPIVRVFVDDQPQQAAQHVGAVMRGLAVEDIQVEEPDLEDSFVALLRRQGFVKEIAAPPPQTSSSTSPNDGLAIQASELIRDFHSFRAVDRVSFEVKPGEIFGLLGANGAGKTTVIKMLTGILKPTTGHGWVAGADMRRARGVLKERIGYMSQAFSLYLDLTVIENIRLFAGIYGLGRGETADRVDWVLNMAGLAGIESALAGRLPMGVRQRLALGCALVHRPRVLFLDEPTSGVDPVGRRRFWDILLHLSREEGVALLVTTHYMSEAEHCDRLALMHAGRIVMDGSPDQMKEETEREAGRLLEITSDQPVKALAHLDARGFSGVALYGTHLHVLSQDPETDSSRIRYLLGSRGISVSSVRERALTLEDVFVNRIMALERRERT